jgi:UDP-4-amino-4,6-dideoxy-N-acetyl-beta-L-altrosamine transaminase
VKFIPYGRQDISQEDIDSVIEVLKSDFLTQGPKVPAFEELIKKYVGARHAAAVNSATSALHCACLALGVGEGDWVWTSPITFVASANCALFCGAKVDFVDIDPNTLNMSPIILKEKLIKAKIENKLPKVIIPVHMAGQSCEMKQLHAIAKEFNVKIIEDASHAIGAEYDGEKVGNCKYSDITIFSFHPVKIVTTAEGGVATTNDQELAIRLDLFRSHGVTRNKNLMQQDSHGPWYYEQIELGYNYRMTEMQAALGISQFSRLDTFIDKRNELAQNYDQKFEKLPLKLFKPRSGINSSYHLYIVQIEDSSRKEEIFIKLREKNIGVNLHYMPVNMQTYYKNLAYASIFKTPSAFAYYEGALSIPLFPGITQDEITYIVNCLEEIL